MKNKIRKALIGNVNLKIKPKQVTISYGVIIAVVIAMIILLPK